ncbi:MAG: phospholipase C, phosphocholine-specific [Bacteroidota bacterium]
MDSRRDFLKKAALLTGSAMMIDGLARAMAINPAIGSTYLDAEHIVILMQENRSFDHCFGTLQGVRGFNDPRIVNLPNQRPVWLQTDALGHTYAPFRLNIKDTKVTWMGDLPHSRASQVDANNYGRYDKWLVAKKSGNKKYAEMPLTLGHFTRNDIPFNYAMADAFTICDQNFCSAMTSTTPNRSFFWTGKITEETKGLPKAHIRNTDFSHAKLGWQTFPELLTQNDISWNFYQNEISCGGGFVGEERAWLANFGCNLLEFFKAYNVKFSERYIANLQKQAETLPAEIDKIQEASPADEQAAIKARTALKNKQEALDTARNELKQWNKESYEKLTAKQKTLYHSAFTINAGDPNYRKIVELTYMDNGIERKLKVPKGDVLHQFRKDVDTGKLPTVSWLASPQNFSDHPSAPWYGAWYVSEVLAILTKNPEVWKKTIFITTYDENDGYFDHVVPFSIPDTNIPSSGKVSLGIETEIEHVRIANEIKQGIPKNQAREAPIGLGFRVPLIVASPWSRGGKVCSEVFDHTSTLQFLEHFTNKKFGKSIKINNISEWRRTICGDLTSVFSPYNGEIPEKIPFLNRDKNIETIFNAKFKEDPSAFKKLSPEEIAELTENPSSFSLQEKGTRSACALPYELYADGNLTADKKGFELNFAVGNAIFGQGAAGSPFTVYAPIKFNGEEVGRNWSFAVKAGDRIAYQWPLEAFENGNYQLRLHGPNGFFREFKGNASNPLAKVTLTYQKALKLTGNVLINLVNNGSKSLTFIIADKAYKAKEIHQEVPAKNKAQVLINLEKSFNWYDISVKVKGNATFEERFAGRVETGLETKTDPLMGKVI